MADLFARIAWHYTRRLGGAAEGAMIAGLVFGACPHTRELAVHRFDFSRNSTPEAPENANARAVGLTEPDRVVSPTGGLLHTARSTTSSRSAAKTSVAPCKPSLPAQMARASSALGPIPP
ncbi:hypothetical protein [Sandaracinus amylolyticus]|uniref:hypothetical protein n=1 Tax=Sandaracinus amylolyticus TaxID=927083 RepID=UPI0012ED06D9|nr:hypothetical protein [Sandaracinus amylolyticus]